MMLGLVLNSDEEAPQHCNTYSPGGLADDKQIYYIFGR